MEIHFEREFKRPTLLLSVLVALLIGIAAGYSLEKSNADARINAIQKAISPIFEQGTDYKFVEPLLAYHAPEATLLGDYVELKANLQAITDTAVGSGGASRVGIYFRDLNAGRWVGINQNDNYYPASLLKVPTMIALYKQAENDPSLLEQTFTYDPSALPTVPFESPSSLVPALSYSVQELINRMVTDSDNGATFTLLNHINPNFLNGAYTALGIPDPGDNSANYQISPHIYGLFFRILFNATYLSSDSSEKALKLLSESTFKDGLVAGVPKGTVVAHKYGEHVLSKGGKAVGIELSDCGIVYFPQHPYLICVMTSAKDEATAAKTIAAASRVSYQAVIQEYTPDATP